MSTSLLNKKLLFNGFPMKTRESYTLLYSIPLALIDFLRPSPFDQSQLALGFLRRCGVGWIFSFQLTHPVACSVVTYFFTIYTFFFLERVCALVDLNYGRRPPGPCSECPMTPPHSASEVSEWASECVCVCHCWLWNSIIRPKKKREKERACVQMDLFSPVCVRTAFALLTRTFLLVQFITSWW